ncbi:FAD-dependent monooxygenase [Geomicrobium sp. JCM 19055]|uniref:FAD-dependent monooxygenase n=1 Tax=Geomicrobium sp. JCM 19055 TaxID=1460649 RepID=UPI001268A03A
MKNFQITGPLKEIILKTKKIIPKQLHTVTNLPSFSKWRAVLIGDAAHGINPNTGYGSTIAMEDALYVAKMLKSYDFLMPFTFSNTIEKIVFKQSNN